MVSRGHKSTQSDNNDSYYVSMTDIMVGLIFIFIIIIMYFAFQLKIQLEARESYSESANEHRVNLLQAIKEYLEEQGILNVQIDVDHGILRLPEGVLFASGVSDIQPHSAADNVAEKLAIAFASILRCSVFSIDEKPYDNSTACKEQNSDYVFIESIFIEGHTDNVPIKKEGLPGDPKLNSNFRLSARRATNTLDILLNKQPLLADFRSPPPQNESLLAASAYGETRPIESNDTKRNRASNRRIDIRLLMYVPETSSALQDYKNRLEKFYDAK